MQKRLVVFTVSCTLALAAICSLHAAISEKTIYQPQEDKTVALAVDYSKTDQCLSRYLSYRDIPSFISKYVQGKKALDYGAGTGISTKFLQAQGLQVVGVDVSKGMLEQAVSNCPNTAFYLIENGIVPFPSKTYDLIFSSLVLFELGSEEEIIAYLAEAKRVMNDSGVFIAVTGSQDMYSKDWLIFKNDYLENQNLKSGDLAKIYLYDAGIEFTDFYWTEGDYYRLFKQAGFQLVEVHYPLGQASEPYAWKAEKEKSPFIILIATKKQNDQD